MTCQDNNVQAPQGASVIAIASGKGGVGKTQLVANLAIQLAKSGRKVVALDGDLGLSNLDLILGVKPERTLLDVMHNGASVQDIVMDTPHGVRLVPACSGRFDLANLSEEEHRKLLATMDGFEANCDILLIDTAAGIGTNAIGFCAAAHVVVVVATPEPTSIADAYAFVKVAAAESGHKRFLFVANMVQNIAEGEKLYGRLAELVDKFLGVSIDYLGSVLSDPAVRQCVMAGTPLVTYAPESMAALGMQSVARQLTRQMRRTTENQGLPLFWSRLAAGRTAA